MNFNVESSEIHMRFNVDRLEKCRDYSNADKYVCRC